MTSKSGVHYFDNIEGQRIVRGAVHVINGQRIRFHAVSKWNKLYWTADCGMTFGKSKVVALAEAKTLDLVEV